MADEHENDTGPRPVREPGLIPDWDTAPGGPRALERGCLCSVLANAAFRARAEVEPCVDPRCPLHAPRAAP